MYIRNFPFNSTKTTLEALGIKVSKDALPRAEYSGPDRLCQNCAQPFYCRRTLNIQATLLTKQATYGDNWEVVLHHRMLAQNPQPWTTMLLSRVPGRGVFNTQSRLAIVTLNGGSVQKMLRVVANLCFPLDTSMHETVTVIVVDDSVR